MMEQIIHKHYIKHDENQYVIDYASDGAGKAKIDKSYIFLKTGGYQFDLNGEVNPSIRDLNGCPIYKNNMELMNESDKQNWKNEQSTKELTPEERNANNIQNIFEMMLENMGVL